MAEPMPPLNNLDAWILRTLFVTAAANGTPYAETTPTRIGGAIAAQTDLDPLPTWRVSASLEYLREARYVSWGPSPESSCRRYHMLADLDGAQTVDGAVLADLVDAVNEAMAEQRAEP